MKREEQGLKISVVVHHGERSVVHSFPYFLELSKDLWHLVHEHRQKFKGPPPKSGGIFFSKARHARGFIAWTFWFKTITWIRWEGWNEGKG